MRALKLILLLAGAATWQSANGQEAWHKDWPKTGREWRRQQDTVIRQWDRSRREALRTWEKRPLDRRWEFARRYWTSPGVYEPYSQWGVSTAEPVYQSETYYAPGQSYVASDPDDRGLYVPGTRVYTSEGDYYYDQGTSYDQSIPAPPPAPPYPEDGSPDYGWQPTRGGQVGGNLGSQIGGTLGGPEGAVIGGSSGAPIGERIQRDRRTR